MPWRHQDSSVADPPPIGVCAEDIRWLCKNVTDLRLVHLAMLYAVGLTTIWKHAGHHPIFKDGEGTVATSMCQFLKFPMAGGVRVGKGTALAANEVITQHTTPPLPSGSQIPKKLDHQKVVEVKNERVLAMKRKAKAAKDRCYALSDIDRDAEYALFKLLQMGTVAKYQNEFEMLIKRVTIPESLLKSFYISELKLDLQRLLFRSNPKTLDDAFSLALAVEAHFTDLQLLEILRSYPSNLGEAFFRARITEARFEDENNQAVDNNVGDQEDPDVKNKQENQDDPNIAILDKVLEESILHTSDKVEVVSTSMVATYEEHGCQDGFCMVATYEEHGCQDGLKHVTTKSHAGKKGDLDAITSKRGPPDHILLSIFLKGATIPIQPKSGRINRAVGKRAAAEGASQRTKRKKTTTLSFALSDSEADESNRSGSGTHHSASPLNTIIPNEGKLATGLILEPVNQTEEDTDQPLDNVEDTTEVNSSLSEHSPQFKQSNPSNEDTRTLRSPRAHIHASGSTGSSFRRDAGLPEPFVPAWNLTTDSILNDAESCRDMMINLVTPVVRSQQSRLSDCQALPRSWFELGQGALAQIDILLTETQNQLLDTVRSQNQLFEDHKALQQVHLGCVRKEADLTEKLVAVEKARDDLLDRDQERERRAHKAVGGGSCFQNILLDRGRRHSALSNMVQRLLLLSSDEYKKSLSDVFNLAIAAGCYPYVEKLVESFRLLSGDLQNMWPKGIGPTLNGNAASASNAADAE
ncbi:hypothetical protein Tco_0503213 [Tanacetum coccineum]